MSGGNVEFLEEIEVLQSIYEDRIRVKNLAEAEEIIGQVIYTSEGEIFTIFVDVPYGYPALSPHVSVSTSQRLSLLRDQASTTIESILREMVGNVVLFSVFEAVREVFEKTEIIQYPSTEDTILSLSELCVESNPLGEVSSQTELSSSFSHRGLSSSNNNHNHKQLEVFHGPVTMESKSSFQSHFAIVHSMEEVHLFRDIVYEDKKVARATHNIFAYRFTCPTTGISYHDQDDDGENAAGGRLAEMIRLMKVDNVAVIVSRWFGGILLGPDRFKFICNSARDLLEAHGLDPSSSTKKGSHNEKKR
eukprot:gene10992-12238_t